MDVKDLFSPRIDLVLPPVPCRFPPSLHGVVRAVMQEWTEAGLTFTADDLEREVCDRVERRRR